MTQPLSKHDWQERDHPRDSDGRFRDKNSWAGVVAGRLTGINQGRDLTDRDSWDWRGLVRRAENQGAPDFDSEPEPGDPYDPAEHGDHYLAEIYREQGYHGLPQVVDRQEMDQLILSGQVVPLYRGVVKHESDVTVPEPEAMHGQMMSGAEHYAGRGVYGNGTYTTPQHETGQRYANVGSGYRGLTMRMALKPGARVVDYNDLKKQWAAAQHDTKAQQIVQDILQGEGPLDLEQMRARQQALMATYDEDWEGLIADLGRFASLAGYDAIAASYDVLAGHYREVVVLNRSALLVDSEPARPWTTEEDRIVGRRPADRGNLRVIAQ